MSNNFIDTESKHSRCCGLENNIAIKIKDLQRIHANNAIKSSGPFMCPECLSDVVVRKCTEKIDHFAHKAKLSPLLKEHDKELHEQCKDELFNLMNTVYPDGNWAKERQIAENKEKGYKNIIPDISGRANGIPVAIEVQKSAYTINKIYNKTLEYRKRKICVLWIVPLSDELGSDLFRPRLFEKYLHSMYYGRIYYYIPNKNKNIIPVHYSPAARYIEVSEWYDKDNDEERIEGGYTLTYKTLKTPNYGVPLNLSSDFQKKINTGFEPKNVKKNIPECYIYFDNLKIWWSLDEYKNLNHQVELAKKSRLFSSYKIDDEYDDFQIN